MVESATGSSLKEYLKRYESKSAKEEKKKKKKKSKPVASSVLVVDEDPVWQIPVTQEEESADESAEEEKPQIEEDVEVKRMKRLEQLRSRQPYHGISEDGSGWVPVSDVLRLSSSNSVKSDLSTSQPSELRTECTDLSPPRQRKRHKPSASLDDEPKPADNTREGGDLSPPRQRRQRDLTIVPDPTVKASELSQEGSDLSPDRRRRPRRPASNIRISDMPDRSPCRFSHHDDPDSPIRADISPPKKINRSSRGLASLDLSPQISTRESTDVSSFKDLSPPRRRRKAIPSIKEQTKTGLLSGQDIKEENAKSKMDELMRYKQMDPSVSGRGAEPIYRDKITGERISREEFSKLHKKEEKPKEKKLEWGKGLAQKREAEEKQLELEAEKNKPFARSRDDADLDQVLKEKVRWGDPMAHLVKRKHTDLVLPDLGSSKNMQDSGFIIPQEIPSHSWIKRGLDAAPNRYGITPGRHWDGVDRSNGFERQMFKRKNEKQATEREAYLWSVSDM